MDIFSELEKAADQEEPSIDLGLISDMVEQQVRLESKADPGKVNTLIGYMRNIKASIQDIEEALKERKRDLFFVRQRNIPEYMNSCGLKKVETQNGVTVEVKQGLSITTKNKEKLHQFVRSHNSGDIIKDTLVIDMDQNQEEILSLVDKTGNAYERKESIHGMTLKKFIKTCLENGIHIPEEVVNVYEYKYSKIRK